MKLSFFYAKPGSRGSQPMVHIDQIRSDLEAFTSAVDQEYYLNGAGLKNKTAHSRLSPSFFLKPILKNVFRRHSRTPLATLHATWL